MTVSLRTRLVSGIVLGTVLLLTLFSLLIYSVIFRSMMQRFDRSLLTAARMMSAIIEEEEFKEEDLSPQGIDENVAAIQRKIEFNFDVRMTPEFSHAQGGAYYQIWGPDGEILARSPSLSDDVLAPAAPDSETPQFRTLTLSEQVPVRAVFYHFSLREEDEGQLQSGQQRHPAIVGLAQSLVPMHTSLRFLRWLLLVTSIAVVLLSTGVAFTVARHSLHPIHRLAEQISAVREQTLDQPICAREYPSELAPICHCLSTVFGRLKLSLTREKQFNANVAHELRTPLSGLRSILEVGLSRSRDAEAYRHAMSDCLTIVQTMHRMIDTLLSLSRLDAGQLCLDRQTVALRQAVEERWRFFADQAHDKAIVFENEISQDASVLTDRERVGMIFSNILENAVEYTPPTGQIRVYMEGTEEYPIVCVANTGCDLTEEQARHVFDFFWRKDTIRSDAGRHFGIGLSVAQKVAGALGMSLAVRVKGDVFCACICFASPAQEHPGGSDDAPPSA